MDGLFLFQLTRDPQYFFMVVSTVVVSIVLHELAHGVAAIRLGDDTPRRAGHMTPNPLVHMGPLSIVVLLVAGLAWGAMPVDPTRLRGKYAEAIVAFAGPLTNFALAFLALTGLGVALGAGAFGAAAEGSRAANIFEFAMIFGGWNLVLGVFNLIPAPPLDGSRVLMNFSRGYRAFVTDPSKQGIVFLLFPLAFIFGGRLVGGVFGWGAAYVATVASLVA